MWFALVFIPQPYGTGVFSLGVLTLGSEYKVLKLVSLDGQYKWIQSRDTLYKRIERNYRAKKFIQEGPVKIDLHPQTGGDFRARVVGNSECLFSGMLFRVYVEAPLHDPDEDLHYHLRLGSAELTRLSETSDGTVSVFFTIKDWETEFEDESEKRFAEDAQRRLREGSDEPQAFAKSVSADRVNEFELDEWKAIYDWSKELDPDRT
ncbi:hypothetical protein [Halegenticoccus tardaugens]|uniref:hypothetical protein n=1 Tax=Halegenticoccus tardaugens TaxID=2071624 RepID=UPI00100A8857|nr:hypothetical protein [Halegenticoccus tardaugens]